jgi:hypothetical protein
MSKSLCFCYRNLNKPGVTWSVRDQTTGLVIDWVNRIVLSGVDLKVSAAGRARVLKQKRKNVHAGIQGKRIKRAPQGEWVRARYNPYDQANFTLENGEAIFKAKYAKLTKEGLYVIL